MQQPHTMEDKLHDGMKTLNMAWYTRKNQLSQVTFQLYKEHIEKDNERDQNMAKIMMHLDILSKNAMGVDTHSVNDIGVWSKIPDEMMFETSYSEEINFLANQGGHYQSNYPRQGGNKGWVRVRMESSK